jgi:hypothetical protein
MIKTTGNFLKLAIMSALAETVDNEVANEVADKVVASQENIDFKGDVPVFINLDPEEWQFHVYRSAEGLAELKIDSLIDDKARRSVIGSSYVLINLIESNEYPEFVADFCTIVKAENNEEAIKWIRNSIEQLKAQITMFPDFITEMQAQGAAKEAFEDLRKASAAGTAPTLAEGDLGEENDDLMAALSRLVAGLAD